MRVESSVIPRVVAVLVAAAAIEIGASDARAQYGMGGFGFMPMRMVPSPSEFINQNAMVNAQRATMGPVSRPVYANNPNSYLSRVRDNGFTPHYSVDSRRSPGMEASRRRRRIPLKLVTIRLSLKLRRFPGP